MGTLLLILVVSLMVGFVLLSFLQKSNNEEDESSILSLEQIKKFNEEE